MSEGKLIVIEGSCDGVGKSTQISLLKQELERDREVIQKHFPNYESPSSSLVRSYLNNELGKVEEISPYAIHAYYAADREYIWRTELKESYEQGKTILVDRYTTSSIIYQTALMNSTVEKINFMKFIMHYEYDLLHIKSPDQVIFLDADFDCVRKQIELRKDNDGIKNDIHESNIELLRKFYESAKFVANYLHWQTVNCTKDNEMLPREEISYQVLKLVK